MTNEPSCPRCGYDLSGQIATWPREHCPLHGLCSECGLDVRWRDVLNPRYNLLRGHFEHAARGRVRALLRTTAAVFRPWRLWSWLSMSHEMVWSRILVVIAFAAVAGHLVFAPMLGLLAIFAGSVPFALTMPPPTIAGLLLWPYWEASWWSGGVLMSLPPPVTLTCVIATLLSPLAFLLVPATLRQAKVRRAHLVRIGLYLLPSLVITISLPALLAALEELAGPGLSNGLFTTPGPRFNFLASLGLTGLWLFIWWWCAAALYLRLRHTFLLAALLTTVALLTSLLVTLAIAWMVPALGHRLFNLLT